MNLQFHRRTHRLADARPAAPCAARLSDRGLAPPTRCVDSALDSQATVCSILAIALFLSPANALTVAPPNSTAPALRVLFGASLQEVNATVPAVLDTIIFDAPTAKAATSTATLTLVNLRNGSTVLGSLKVSAFARITNATAAVFTLVDVPPTLTLANTTNTTLTVVFAPLAAGVFNATILIIDPANSTLASVAIAGTSVTLLSTNASCVPFSIETTSISMLGDTVHAAGCFPLGLEPTCTINGITAIGVLNSVSSVSCPSPPIYFTTTAVLSTISFPNGYVYTSSAAIAVTPVAPKLSLGSGGLLGGESITVTGVVFDPSQIIAGRIGGQLGACTYVSSASAVCVVPILYSVGPLGVCRSLVNARLMRLQALICRLTAASRSRSCRPATTSSPTKSICPPLCASIRIRWAPPSSSPTPRWPRRSPPQPARRWSQA